ncbi:hypothetical protein [Auritidibacter ignavus]|uniref:hypothetical protein n=1 Tax=Auritidibacter ignavus TaxID=678932 RepID=UPI00244B6E65|nr:hypothetical protein [Auritidibacter ignavus]WGH87439.1 hypothetical protein QDX24_10905 [Auritidibacter ignavus]WGH89729.1 hypothetical protein QDX22_10905 [Auritidibacter ignavus]
MTQGTEDPHNGQHVSAGLDRNLAEQAQRRLLEEQLINNELTALVATSALGMGFDKPDRGFVIRLGAGGIKNPTGLLIANGGQGPITNLSHHGFVLGLTVVP